MRWRREDLAWAAGVIEGEGSIYKSKRNPRSWQISVGMTDLDVVERLCQITGLGKVAGPYVVERCKPLWTWKVIRQGEVYALLAAVWTWLGQRRREKARQALAILPPVGRQSYPPRLHGRFTVEKRR